MSLPLYKCLRSNNSVRWRWVLAIERNVLNAVKQNKKESEETCSLPARVNRKWPSRDVCRGSSWPRTARPFRHCYRKSLAARRPCTATRSAWWTWTAPLCLRLDQSAHSSSSLWYFHRNRLSRLCSRSSLYLNVIVSIFALSNGFWWWTTFRKTIAMWTRAITSERLELTVFKSLIRMSTDSLLSWQRKPSILLKNLISYASHFLWLRD